MVITSKNPIIINIALTLLCATALAMLTIFNSAGTTGLIAIAIVFTLFLSQLTLARHHARQVQRTDRYHRLGRKLLQLKRTKKRDEKIAIKVLNHIVNQSSQTIAQTSIWQLPLETFSGDLALATSDSEGRTYTLLADLTGHGIAAAMGATPVASIFQATAHGGLPVEEIIVELNSKLTHMLPSGFFCCVAVAMCHKGQLTVCNAGLPALVVANEKGHITDRIESDQIPLGIQAFEAENVSLFTQTYAAGHHLYAYTDGLIEATNKTGNTFDEQTLESLICVRADTNGRLKQIRSGFEQFVKGTPQNDDISMVEVNIC